MNCRNVLWMLRFTIRKKWIWLLSVIVAMYCVLVPYQKNLLLFFGNPETAEQLFWKSVYLFHNAAALVVLFHIAVQVLNTETYELHLMWKWQIRAVLSAGFLMFQVLMLPEYIWYVSIYPYSVGRLFLLIFMELVNVLIFYAISVKTRKTIIGFVLTFLLILLLFGI